MGELSRDSVVNQWLTTAEDCKTYRVDYYNLGAVLTVMQLRVYHATLARGTDVDKPRNLAKSVTVE